jgi:hypothetical protein
LIHTILWGIILFFCIHLCTFTIITKRNEKNYMRSQRQGKWNSVFMRKKTHTGNYDIYSLYMWNYSCMSNKAKQKQIWYCTLDLFSPFSYFHQNKNSSWYVQKKKIIVTDFNNLETNIQNWLKHLFIITSFFFAYNNH